MEDSHKEYWAVVRISCTDARRSGANCALQVLAPWNLLGGNSNRGQYFIRSKSDLIFIVVGPRNHSTPNVRLSGGDSSEQLWLIEYDQNPRQLNRLSADAPTYAELVVRLSAPRPQRIDKAALEKVWKAIEVHSVYDHKTAEGVRLRLEHHLPARVPPPECWDPASHGGYGAANAHTLQGQAQAAIAWQFGAQRVLRDSGWGLEARPAGFFLSLMGFETNNVFHDDHRAHGAHWHLASRFRDHKERNQTPHLYLTASGGLDLDKIRQVEHRVGWEFGHFAIRVMPDHSLALGPVTCLQHSTSQLWCHVRQTKQAVHDPIAVWSKLPDPGNRWMLLQQNQSSWLCSTRSWNFLSTIGPAVIQSSAADEDSRWSIQDQGDTFALRNEQSGQYLSVPSPAADRTATQQRQEADSWTWAPLSRCQSSYSIAVQATAAGAGVEIHKDGQRLSAFTTSDNAAEGCLMITENGVETRRFYEPLTGRPKDA